MKFTELSIFALCMTLALGCGKKEGPSSGHSHTDSQKKIQRLNASTAQGVFVIDKDYTTNPTLVGMWKDPGTFKLNGLDVNIQIRITSKDLTLFKFITLPNGKMIYGQTTSSIMINERQVAVGSSERNFEVSYQSPDGSYSKIPFKVAMASSVDNYQVDGDRLLHIDPVNPSVVKREYIRVEDKIPDGAILAE